MRRRHGGDCEATDSGLRMIETTAIPFRGVHKSVLILLESTEAATIGEFGAFASVLRALLARPEPTVHYGAGCQVARHVDHCSATAKSGGLTAALASAGTKPGSPSPSIPS